LKDKKKEGGSVTSVTEKKGASTIPEPYFCKLEQVKIRKGA